MGLMVRLGCYCKGQGNCYYGNHGHGNNHYNNGFYSKTF